MPCGTHWSIDAAFAEGDDRARGYRSDVSVFHATSDDDDAPGRRSPDHRRQRIAVLFRGRPIEVPST
jgi:hypothetical protein